MQCTYAMRVNVDVSCIFARKDSRCGSSISTLKRPFVHMTQFYSTKSSFNIARS